MNLINLSPTQLRKAANLKEQIEGLHKQLSIILGGSGSGMPSPFKAAKPAPKKKGGMSAAGRASIVAAQKARWAKIKAAKIKPASAPKPAKKKFTMSAAAKAKISAAAKARWAKIRAAKK
jgi:hypothetical protein